MYYLFHTKYNTLLILVNMFKMKRITKDYAIL